MTVDITPLLRGEVSVITVDCGFVPDRAPEGVRLLPGARISGRISDSGGYIRLTSAVTVPYAGRCARCLDRVEGTLGFRFDRTLAPENTVTAELLEEEADEYLPLKDGFLDPDAALGESVFLEFPMVLLCSPDCRGLCPRCGKKLPSEGGCGCSPREIDPRMEKLKELFPD